MDMPSNVYLFINQVDMCVISTVALTYNMTMDICVQFFLWSYRFTSARSRAVGTYANCMVSILNNCQTVVQADYSIFQPTSNV